MNEIGEMIRVLLLSNCFSYKQVMDTGLNL